MDVSIDDHWEGFLHSAVESGEFASASEVVRAGLRLIEQRAAKLVRLREMVAASRASGECLSDEEVGESLEATIAELIREGY